MAADVKWIKINIDILSDNKMKLIDTLPEADAIFRIWIGILSLAGQSNKQGMIFLAENMPYTDEMLATLFNRPVNVVRLALQTLQSFKMLEIFDNGVIYISNWEKHQDLDKLAGIREKTRLRTKKYREKAKAIGNVTVTPRDVEDKTRLDKTRLDKTRLEENRIDKISNKDEPNGSEAIYLNNSDITKPLIISSSDAPNLCLSCSYEELPNFEGPVIMGCKSAMPFKNRKMFWRDSTYPIKCEAFKLKVNSKPEAREQAVNQTTVKQNKGATSNQQAIEPFLNHNCQAKSKPSQEKKPVRLKKFDEAEINLFKQFSEKFLVKTGMKYHSAKYFADLTNCKSILKRADNSNIDLDRIIDYLLSDKIFEGYNKNIQTLNKHLENFAVELKSANCKDDGSLSSRQANQTTEEAQRDLDRMEAHQKMIRENKKGGHNG